jgi:Arc/MetJ-type ribon-helix-helix transcriptional regulator
MAKTSLSLPDEMNEQIESELSYGDNKSEWIRHSIKMRQHVDPILDELYESHQREERLQFVEKAVREKADEIKQDPNRGNGNGGGL